MPLSQIALIGIQAVTSDKKKLRFHLLLSSFVGDLLDSEYWLSVKSGVSTSILCHNCLIEKTYMLYSTAAELRTLRDTLHIISRLLNGDVSAIEEAKNSSLLPIPPALTGFAMLGIHPSVDVYSFFRFEPMHNLALDISHMLKECLVQLLKD